MRREILPKDSKNYSKITYYFQKSLLKRIKTINDAIIMIESYNYTMYTDKNLKQIDIYTAHGKHRSFKAIKDIISSIFPNITDEIVINALYKRDSNKMSKNRRAFMYCPGAKSLIWHKKTYNRWFESEDRTIYDKIFARHKKHEWDKYRWDKKDFYGYSKKYLHNLIKD